MEHPDKILHRLMSIEFLNFYTAVFQRAYGKMQSELYTMYSAYWTLLYNNGKSGNNTTFRIDQG